MITLWSYQALAPKVWRGTMRDGLHRPHGLGNFWQAGSGLTTGGADEWRLAGEDDLTSLAQHFLQQMRTLFGPSDARWWMSLFGSPMQGWPSQEIITAAYLDDRMRPLIPVDIAGMLTPHNPGSLYLIGEVK